MKKEKVIINDRWGNVDNPFLTVITPVYNRRNVLKRAIDSVERQSFRDIEYIIIDDGSTDSIDDIVEEFMESTELPVMFVKKNNGGVHTARNAGYKRARGKLILCVDSDDELKFNACEIFYKEWQKIPNEDKKYYWQMKAQFVDQNGQDAGSRFPDGINELPIEESWKYFSMAKGDQMGCRVAKVMKENLFPEPEGVKFVTENVRWIPLERKYRSWGINETVAICHREGDDHLSKGDKKKTKQDLRNMFWNVVYRLNNFETFVLSFVQRLESICKYCVLAHLLMRQDDKKIVKKFKLKGVQNNFWKIFFWMPSMIFAKIYYNRKVKV